MRVTPIPKTRSPGDEFEAARTGGSIPRAPEIRRERTLSGTFQPFPAGEGRGGMNCHGGDCLCGICSVVAAAPPMSLGCHPRSPGWAIPRGRELPSPTQQGDMRTCDAGQFFSLLRLLSCILQSVMYHQSGRVGLRTVRGGKLHTPTQGQRILKLPETVPIVARIGWILRDG